MGTPWRGSIQNSDTRTAQTRSPQTAKNGWMRNQAITPVRTLNLGKTSYPCLSAPIRVQSHARIYPDRTRHVVPARRFAVGRAMVAVVRRVNGLNVMTLNHIIMLAKETVVNHRVDS